MHYYDQILLFAALIGVAANIVQIIVQLTELLRPRRTVENRGVKVNTIKHSKLRLGIVVAVILATVLSAGAVVYATGGSFKNVQLTREAWRSLEAKDYEATIRTAEECVTLFQDEALRQQEELAQKGATVPLGKVGKDQKAAIFQRGLLNDVATCWFILGKAHAAKGDTDKAQKAFNKALQLTYARCYDPSNDTFWAPSDGAKVELKKISGRSIYD